MQKIFIRYMSCRGHCRPSGYFGDELGTAGIQRPEPDDGEFRNEAGSNSCRRWKIMRWSFRI